MTAMVRQLCGLLLLLVSAGVVVVMMGAGIRFASLPASGLLYAPTGVSQFVRLPAPPPPPLSVSPPRGRGDCAARGCLHYG